MTTHDQARTGTEARAGWLELARRQSHALAANEARRTRSFRWESPRRARGGFFAFLLRPAWAAVAVVVLAGSVTLAAYVAHRAPAKKAPPAPAKQAPTRTAPAAAAPTPRTAVETLEPAEMIAATPKTAPPRRAAKAPEPKQAPAEKIILGPEESDGAGEMIIVPAPRTKKLPPLFTPEDYKQRGRRPRL